MPSVTLQPDGTDGKDTSVMSLDEGTNYGSNAKLYIGERTGIGNVTRALIAFNLTALPAAALISSAVLSLYLVADRSDNNRNHCVYRQKRAWSESQATWNIYSTGHNWATAGGFGAEDCEQTDIGSRTMLAAESVGVKTWTLTPTSKAALDLGYGWLIKADTENDDGYEFVSSDGATSSQRPLLVIDYTLPGSGGIFGSSIFRSAIFGGTVVR